MNTPMNINVIMGETKYSGNKYIYAMQIFNS